jgi:hypothetical protein
VLDYKGDKILSKDQTEMMTYGSEVGMCQYGIFCKIRSDKKAIDRRKVSRLGDVDVVKELNKVEYQVNPQTLEAFMS